MMTRQDQHKTEGKAFTYPPEHERSLIKSLACAKAAIDKKCEKLKILDLTEMNAFADFFVICSGTNERQVQAIGNSIARMMKEQDFKPVSIEGENDGRWVLMDYGDVVIHVFLDAIRDYYGIDKLWTDARSVIVPPEFYGPAASQVN